MTDFWEILGRTVMDNTLRKTMYDAFVGSTPATVYNPTSTRVLFKDADYITARQLMAAVVKGPVSLFGEGEWLMMAILQPASQKALDLGALAAQAKVPPPVPHGPVFYQALGAMIIDDAFVQELISGKEGAYGFHLTPAERVDLLKFATDPAFINAAQAFHFQSWSQACEAMVIQSASADPKKKYHHPLEPWTTPPPPAPPVV